MVNQLKVLLVKRKVDPRKIRKEISTRSFLMMCLLRDLVMIIKVEE